MTVACVGHEHGVEDSLDISAGPNKHVPAEHDVHKLICKHNNGLLWAGGGG